MIDSENNYNKEITGEILCRIAIKTHNYGVARRTKKTYSVRPFEYEISTETNKPRRISCPACGRTLYLRQNYLKLYAISIPIVFFGTIFSLGMNFNPNVENLLIVIVEIVNLLFWSYLGKKQFLFPFGLKLADGYHWYSGGNLTHKLRNIGTRKNYK